MSRWYKTDLQIASPAGGFALSEGDWTNPKQRAAAIAAYVKFIKDAGIEVFAVTDHNATSMLAEIRDEASKQGLVMFPGMELSTGTGADGVHLLLIGDPDADIAALTHAWTTAADFTKDHPAFDPNTDLHMPSHKSLFDILSALPEDTLAIAPHILAENGIGSGDSIKEATLRWRALHSDGIAAVDPGQPSGDGGWNDKFRMRDLENFPAVARMPYVSTSDSYKPQQVGTRYTWIRMHEPTLACLRQALLDYGARILCDWDRRLTGDPNEIKHAYVRSIHLDGLTTSDTALELEFDPRINVIIGSRGSGKSTIIQGLRALYGYESRLPDVVEEESNRYQDQVFRDATIRSAFIESVSGAEGNATWTLDAGTTSDNSLINVRVVTQKELFERTSGDRIEGESSSANMLALVDEALEDDKVAADLLAEGVDITGLRGSNFDDTVEELRRIWHEAVLDRLDAEHKVAGRKKVDDSIKEVKRKLGALDNEEDKEKVEAANETLADDKTLRDAAGQVRNAAEEIEAIELPELPELNTTPATVLAASLTKGIEAFQTGRDILLTQLRAATDTVESDRTADDTDFAKLLANAKATTTAYKKKLEDLGVDMSQYTSLQASKDEYEEALAGIDETAASLSGLQTIEADAWSALAAHYQVRLDTRQAFVALVEKRTPSLSFELSASADYAGWKQQVHRTFGFRVGDHVDSLEAIGTWLWSLDLPTVDRVGHGETWRTALIGNSYSGLPGGTTSAFRERLKSATEATRVEAASLIADDRFDMKFLRTGKKPDSADAWQTVTDGSPGQRSAAMLAFTLSYGDSPLVLDQPEDDLDSALVSELIVTQFRDARWKRQLIVVTHEANIPVNTDAETTVVLESAGGALRVMQKDGVPVSGPIDDGSVREQIQHLLEGGVIAFVNRERRYDNELSQYRRDVQLLSKK
jgi:ABC-type lipoprotein export system ATPase subunit